MAAISDDTASLYHDLTVNAHVWQHNPDTEMTNKISKMERNSEKKVKPAKIAEGDDTPVGIFGLIGKTFLKVQPALPDPAELASKDNAQEENVLLLDNVISLPNQSDAKNAVLESAVDDLSNLYRNKTDASIFCFSTFNQCRNNHVKEIICRAIGKIFSKPEKISVSLSVLDLHAGKVRDLQNRARAVDKLCTDRAGEINLNESSIKVTQHKKKQSCVESFTEAIKLGARLLKTQHRYIHGTMVTILVLNQGGVETSRLLFVNMPSTCEHPASVKDPLRREEVACLQLQTERAFGCLSGIISDVGSASACQRVIAGAFTSLKAKRIILIPIVSSTERDRKISLLLLDKCNKIRRSRSSRERPAPPKPKPPTRKAPSSRTLQRKWSYVARPVHEVAKANTVVSSSDTIFTKGSIQSIIIVRPFIRSSTPQRIHTALASGKAISFVDPGNRAWSKKLAKSTYAADYVFDFCKPDEGHSEGLTVQPPWQSSEHTHEDVARGLGGILSSKLWLGRNVTLIACGHVRSGKSRFMIGTRSEEGLLPSIVNDILLRGKVEYGKASKVNLTVRASEIYLGKAYDLLNKRRNIRKAEEGKNGKEVRVTGEDSSTLWKYLDAIDLQRKRASMDNGLGQVPATRGHMIVDLDLSRKDHLGGSKP